MTYLKSLFLAAILAASTLPAFANGYVEPAVVAPVSITPPSADWTGAYVGGSLAYGRFAGTFCENGSTSDCTNFTNPQTLVVEPDGALFGITGGYDWQSGNIVYGVAADVMLGDLSAVEPTSAAYACGGVGGCELSVNWLAMLRGRVGYAASDQLMPYATAGVALTNVTVNFPALPPSIDDTATNFVAGLGGEYRLSDTMSIGAEYLHIFEREEHLGSGIGGDPDLGATRFNADLLRINLTYRF